ncbi:MAG: DNA translocase FtsK 4TM domain-containing protein [Thermoguttaceae bacterium]|nr:DNA translocase FtsK 4TM domain-containing protein [Thermoguttaceae bacterium]
MGRMIFGILLVAFVLFLGASLCSFSALDPPATVSYPADTTCNNWCGRSGAAVAWFLVNAFGLGVWFLLLCGNYFAVVYWSKNGLAQPIVKALGAVILLSSLCGTVAFVFADYSPGTTYGAGGSWGALIKHSFSYCFAPLGSFVFLISLFVTGIILICDSTLLRIFLWASGIYVVTDIVLSPFRPKDKTRLKTELEKSPEKEKNDGVKPIPAKPHPVGISVEGSLGTSCNQLPVTFATYANTPTTARDTMSEFPNETIAQSKTRIEQDEPVPNAALEVTDEENDEDDAEEFVPEEYVCPELELLTPSEAIDYDELENKARSRSAAVEQAFVDYGYRVKVVGIQTGPILTQYEVQLTTGTRLNQIKSLEPDIALSLKAQSVRISTISGRGTIGLELPNEDRQLVRLRELLEECPTEIEKMELPLFLGRNVAGRPLVVDLTKMPHLLIAGRTGTGKSVCLNAIIMSILMCRTPEQVRMILIDPKMVELNFYSPIPHLMHPVVTDMRQAEAILGWAVDKMEERLSIFKRAYVRQLSEFNKLSLEELKRRVRPETEEEWEDFPKKIPYVVIVADEMADLMMTAGKEVETHITRLAQKSRAVGIHLVLATQKPTVDIITGLIKSNLPARIAFGVASRIDSQVVLDAKGAEQLLGNGDMLFLQPGTSFLVRGQGTYVSDKEITGVVSEIATDKQFFEIDVNTLIDQSEQGEPAFRPRDSRYEECVNVIFQHGKGKASTSMLQRLLGFGYNRAARIIDSMVKDGIVTDADPHKPQQPRDILITFTQWQEQKDSILGNGSASGKPEPASVPNRQTQESNDFIPIKPAPVVPFTSFENINDEPMTRPLYPHAVLDKAPAEPDATAPWEEKHDEPRRQSSRNSSSDSDDTEQARYDNAQVYPFDKDLDANAKNKSTDESLDGGTDEDISDEENDNVADHNVANRKEHNSIEAKQSVDVSDDLQAENLNEGTDEEYEEYEDDLDNEEYEDDGTDEAYDDANSQDYNENEDHETGDDETLDDEWEDWGNEEDDEDNEDEEDEENIDEAHESAQQERWNDDQWDHYIESWEETAEKANENENGNENKNKNEDKAENGHDSNASSGDTSSDDLDNSELGSKKQ